MPAKFLLCLLCFVVACSALQSSPASFASKRVPSHSAHGLMRLRGGAPAAKAAPVKKASSGLSLKAIAATILSPKIILAAAIVAIISNAKGCLKSTPAPKDAPAPKAKSGCLGLGCCGL